MKMVNDEIGETRTGCFSSQDSSDVHLGIKIPICPSCGSTNYSIIGSNKVKCSDCKFEYNFNLNR